MNLIKRILPFLYCLLFICESCAGQEVARLRYQQETFIIDSLQEIPLKHKTWKTLDLDEILKSTADVKSNTVLVVDSNIEVDKLELPNNIELNFKGGSLKGQIIFNNTYLSGKVRLQGATISGSVANDCFEAGWICHGNGKRDDAESINQILGVCKNIYFNRGTYLLSSYHKINPELQEQFRSSVESHVGIYQDDITLTGEDGAAFLIKDTGAAICVYSRPEDIKNSTRNIFIKDLTFRVENDGKEFHEFVHTIKMVGVNKIIVDNCKFFDYWGDAICLSHYGDSPQTGERTLNSNVSITNNYIDGDSHNNRNGISLVSAYRVQVIGNTIVESSKGNMPGAIDIEANNKAYTTEKIVIRNNIISKCNGGVGSISIVSNNQEAPAKSIVIQGNYIESSTNGICILVESQESTGYFKVLDNTFYDCKNPMIFRGKGKSKYWVIKGNKYNKLIKPKIGGDIQVSNLKTGTQ